VVIHHRLLSVAGLLFPIYPSVLFETGRLFAFLRAPRNSNQAMYFHKPAATRPESDEDFSASDFSEVEAENSGPTTARSKKDEDNEPARPVKIATKENQAVFWSRALVIAVLILAAAGAASLTYLFTSNAETKVFEGDVSAGPKQRFFSVHFQAARTHMIRSLFITV
jgi:hypothetical protein